MALKKNPQATKCSDHGKTSLIAHTAKIVAKILSRIERKLQDVLGDQFGFKRGKGTRNATGMLRISEQTVEIDAEVIWPSQLDQLMQGIGIDRRERRH